MINRFDPQKDKIYSLLVVKNEGDIIVSSLRDAIRCSDKIIVIDNGSEDDTWKKINIFEIIFWRYFNEN